MAVAVSSLLQLIVSFHMGVRSPKGSSGRDILRSEPEASLVEEQVSHSLVLLRKRTTREVREATHGIHTSVDLPLGLFRLLPSGAILGACLFVVV